MQKKDTLEEHWRDAGDKYTTIGGQRIDLLAETLFSVNIFGELCTSEFINFIHR